MAVPTLTAPDLITFSAVCIGSESIDAKDQYEAALDFKFIRGVYVPAVNMVFDAVQLYSQDKLRSNFSARIKRSDISQIQILQSFPLNQLIQIYAAISSSAYEGRPSLKYTYLSFEHIKKAS